MSDKKVPKVTQNYKLFSLLESGELVTIKQVAEGLDITEKSIPVYIHELRNKFKAEIETVRNGKQAIGYKLSNASKIKKNIPMYRVGNSIFVKPEKKVEEEEAPVVETAIAPVLEDQEESKYTHYSEPEINDLKDSLGLGSIGSDTF